MRTTFRALLATFFGHRRQVGVFFFSTLLIVSVFFLAPAAARAEDTSLTNTIGQEIGLLVGNLFLFFTEILGKLLLFVMDTFLVPVAGYNGFVTELVVQQGWVIVRDLTNMFFVLMMLVISIGTILGIEEFSYRRLLPRLLVMAVLINFSKVIVGLMIDFSQVVMLTFVNGFSAAAGGNMIQLLHLEKTMDISEGLPTQKLDIWDFIGAQFLGLLMIIISLMIIVVMCMMLAFRIVMLWILTILSPLVFFLSTVQKGKAQQAYAQWWDKLGTYLVSGPVLAFFLWLALSVSAAGGLTKDFDSSGEVSEVGNAQQYFVSSAGSRDSLVGYIIGVAMLLGGMYITADFGAAGGSLLRSGADFVSKTAPRALGRFAYRKAVEEPAAAAERTWFAKTGIMIPFGKRSQEMNKQIQAQKEQRATTEGLLMRRNLRFSATQDAQDKAAAARGKAVDAARETAHAEQARDALLQPVVAQRSSAKQMRDGVAQDTFVMNDDFRSFIDDRRDEILAQLNYARGTGNTARVAAFQEQVNELNRMSAMADGTTGSWFANAERRATRQTIRQNADDLDVDATANETTIRGSAGWAAADAEVKRRADAQKEPEREAKKAEKNAQEWRRSFAKHPETRYLNAALAKAQSEAMDALPKNMNATDRMNALRDAWDSGDKATFQLMMDKMSQEEELPDLLNDGILGEKYGTNTDGLKAFSEDIQKKFAMNEQETLRMLSGVLSTASGKGQHVFRGRIATDLTSGAQRWNTEGSAALAQARKINGIGSTEFWRKDNTAAILTTNQTGIKTLTQAGIYKLAATQEKFLELLAKNDVNQSVLQALKENKAQLEAMVTAGVLDKATVDAISSAVSKKIVSATEIAKNRANL